MRITKPGTTIVCSWRLLLAVLSVQALILAGCAPSQPVESDLAAHGHQLPRDYAAAVTAVAEHCQTIEEAFAAGTPEKCDEALHELVELLNQVPALAEASALPETERDQVAAAVTELFNSLDQLHAGFHGDAQGVDYADVAEAVDGAVETLQSKAALAGSETAAAHTGHDDDHGHDQDHGEHLHAGHADDQDPGPEQATGAVD
jgi:hypothetical protein